MIINYNSNYGYTRNIKYSRLPRIDANCCCLKISHLKPIVILVSKYEESKPTKMTEIDQ